MTTALGSTSSEHALPQALWRARGLTVRSADGDPILEDVDLAIGPKERVAVLGDRGAGKSALAMTLFGLWPSDITVSGDVHADGMPYLNNEERTRKLRRTVFGWIPQDVSRALCPHVRIGRQLMDAHQLVHRSTSSAAKAAALNALIEHDVADAEQRLRHLPHRLSLAQRQRVVLAMVSLRSAKLLVADEPTSALDATSQARLLRRLTTASRDEGQALLLLTHDPALAWLVAERVVVMHGGVIVEEGPCDTVLTAPRHPMTMSLLAAVPPLRPSLAPRPRYDRPEQGCPFAPECADAIESCTTALPALAALSPVHNVRCPIHAERG